MPFVTNVNHMTYTPRSVVIKPIHAMDKESHSEMPIHSILKRKYSEFNNSKEFRV